MSWVKLDDQFFRHPKVLAAGRDARDLYMVGLCYCAQGLTDGFIPSQAVRVLAAEAEIDTGPASAARLVDVGLWETTEGGYAVHDYHEYQPSKERVLATREARAEAGSRGGKQKASNLLQQNASKTLANPKQKSAPYPSRTHPVPVPSPDPIPIEDDDAGAPAPKKARAVKRSVDSFAPNDDEIRAWQRQYPELDVPDQLARLRNYCRSHAKEYADYHATFDNWLRRAVDEGPHRGGRSPNGLAQLTPNNQRSVAAITSFDPTRRHR